MAKQLGIRTVGSVDALLGEHRRPTSLASDRPATVEMSVPDLFDAADAAAVPETSIVVELPGELAVRVTIPTQALVDLVSHTLAPHTPAGLR